MKFRRKKIIPIIVFVTIMLIFFAFHKINDNTLKININGDKKVTIKQNTEYVDDGATAKDKNGNELTVDSEGKVNTSKKGQYVITYKTKDKEGNSTTEERIIEVVDETGELVEKNSDEALQIILSDTNRYTVELGDELPEFNASANGKYPLKSLTLDTSMANISFVGTKQLAFTAIDENANVSILNFTINVVDTKAPTAGFTPEKTTVAKDEVTVTLDVFDLSGVKESKYAWVLEGETLDKDDPTWETITNPNINSSDKLGNVSGRYNLLVYAIDEYDNDSITRSGVYELSAKIPAPIEIKQIDCATWCQSTTIKIDYNTEPLVQMFRVNNGRWMNYTGEFKVSENGVITAMSNDGYNTEYMTFNVTNIDLVKPTIGLTTTTPYGPSAMFSTDIILKDNASGLKYVSYSFETSPDLTDDDISYTVLQTYGTGILNSTKSITKYDEGNYYLYIITEDYAGNITRYVSDVIKIDARTASIVVLPNGTDNFVAYQDYSIIAYSPIEETNITTVQYGYSTTANESGVTKWNNITGNGIGTPTVTVDNLTIPNTDITTTGIYYVIVKATDSGGRNSLYVSEAFQIDIDSPLVDYQYNETWAKTAKATAKQDASTEIKITDIHSGIKTIEYTWSNIYKTIDDINNITDYINQTDFTIGSTTHNSNIKLPNSGNGEFYLWVRAEDIAGNSQVYVEGPYIIDNASPSISLSKNGQTDGNEATTNIITNDDFGINTIEYAWSDINNVGQINTIDNWQTYPATKYTVGSTSVTTEDDYVKLNAVSGNYYLWVRVRDIAGNERIYISSRFRINSDLPVIKFIPNEAINPITGAWVMIDIEISSTSPVNKIIYAISSDGINPDILPFTDYISKITLDGYTGAYYLLARAYDEAGNDTGIVSSGLYNLDSINPTITINTPPDGSAIQKIDASVDIADLNSGIAKVEYAFSEFNKDTLGLNVINYTEYTGYTKGINNLNNIIFSTTTNGNLYLWISVTDVAGNVYYIVSDDYYIIDNIIPNQPIIKYADEAITWVTGNRQIEIISDGEDIVYSIDNGPFIPYTGTFTIDKNSRIEAKAVSRSGMISLTAVKIITNIDNELTTITVDEKDMGLTRDSFKVPITLTDNLSGIKFIEYKWLKVNNDLSQSFITEELYTAPKSHTLNIPLDKTIVSEDGNYYLYVRITDVAGNISNLYISLDTFNLDTNAPIIEFNPYSDLTGKSILDIIVTASDISNLKSGSYTWQNVNTGESVKTNFTSSDLTALETGLHIINNDLNTAYYKLIIELEDSAGNKTTSSSGDYFELNELPKAPIIIYSKEWTNQPIVITITTDQEDATIWYKTGDINEEDLQSESTVGWTKYDPANKPTINSNDTSIAAKAINAVGVSPIDFVTITNYDSLAPTLTLIKDVTENIGKSVNYTVTMLDTDNISNGLSGFSKNNKYYYTWSNLADSNSIAPTDWQEFVTYDIYTDNLNYVDGTAYIYGKIPTKNIEDGKNILYVKVVDIAGNIKIANETFIIDNTAPLIEFLPTNAGSISEIISASKTVKVTDLNNVTAISYQWSIDGNSPWIDLTPAQITTAKTGITLTSGEVNGVVSLWVKATDSIGNTITLKTETFNINNTKPTTPIITPENNGLYINKQIFTITKGNLTENVLLYYGITTDESVPTTWIIYNPFTKPEITINNSTIYVKAVNTLGAESIYASYTVTNIDDTAPYLNILETSILPIKKVATNVEIYDLPPTSNSGINSGSMQYAWTNNSITNINDILSSEWKNTSELNTIYSPDDIEGLYTLWVRISDNAGNIGYTSYTYTIDVTPPIAYLKGLTEVTAWVGEIYIDEGLININDNIDVLSDITITMNPNIVNTTIPGTITLTYSVCDRAGNCNETLARTVNIKQSNLNLRYYDPLDPTNLNLNPVLEASKTSTYDLLKNMYADDTKDGDLSDKITVTSCDKISGIGQCPSITNGILNLNSLGEFAITYQVKNSLNQVTTFTRIITIKDTTAPVIKAIEDLTVMGGTNVNLLQGVVITDNYDSTFTIVSNPNILGVVVRLNNNIITNTATLDEGDYTIEYTVRDSSGNTDKITRKLSVINIPLIEKLGCSAGVDCYVPGDNTTNYLWYSGFLWRIYKVNADGSMKIITEENVTSLAYGAALATVNFSNSPLKIWLDEYFYPKLNQPNNFLTNADYCTDASTVTTAVRTTCTNAINTNISLLTLDEFNLITRGGTNYLKIGQEYWLNTPYNATTNNNITATGTVKANIAKNQNLGIRPVVTLKIGANLTNNAGTKANPYHLSEEKVAATNDLLNTRYSGEYIKYAGDLWRIVDKNEDNTTKIVMDNYYQNSSFYPTATANQNLFNPARSTTVSGVTWTTTNGRTAGNFTGSATNNNIPIATTLSPTMTIEMWAYPRDFANRFLFQINANAGLYFTTAGIYINTTTGTPTNQFKKNGVNTPLPTLNIEHHFAVVFNKIDNITDLYIDGVYAGSASYVAPIGTSLHIGSSIANANKYNGTIRDIRVWNEVRNEDTIRSNMYFDLSGNEYGLILFYPLDEGIGTLVYDHSSSYSSVRYATVTGAPTWNETNGLTFSSTVAASIPISTPDTLTVSAWGYALGTTNTTLWSFANTNGPELYFSGGYIHLQSTLGTDNPFKNAGVKTAIPSLNAWHHYAVTFDKINNKADLYIDGVYAGTATYKNPTSATFHIGKYSGGTANNWNGYIKDVRIYSKILTTSEIINAKDYDALVPNKDLALYLKMNEGSTNFLLDSSGYVDNQNIAAYLNTTVYSNLLQPIDKLMLSKGTWYRGLYLNNNALDSNSSLTSTNGIEANIGLLRVGEMLTGYSPTMTIRRNYWTLTPGATNTQENYIHSTGASGNVFPVAINTKTNYVRPAVNIKDDVYIISGTGTSENPYILKTDLELPIPTIEYINEIAPEEIAPILETNKTERYDLTNNMFATDTLDGDISYNIKVVACDKVSGRDECPRIIGKEIALDKIGVYDITYMVRNTFGSATTFTRRVTIKDNTPPTVEFTNDALLVVEGTIVNLLHKTIITDNYETDNNFIVTTNENIMGLVIKYNGEILENTSSLKEGIYTIDYIIRDSSGNHLTYKRTLNVINNPIAKKYNFMLDNGKDFYVPGDEANNYLWYSGFLWRIYRINEDGSYKVVTEENVTNIAYSNALTTFKNNAVYNWLDPYFYQKLNGYDDLSDSNKYIVENNPYCAEVTTVATPVRTTCTSTSVIESRIGLLTIDEYNLVTNGTNNYLKNGLEFYTMTPNTSTLIITLNGTTGAKANSAVTLMSGVRPVLTINPYVGKLNTTNNGSLSKPYEIKDIEKATTNDLLNTRYSGEYVKYAGKTWRIVDGNDNNNTRIVLDDYYGVSPFNSTTGTGMNIFERTQVGALAGTPNWNVTNGLTFSASQSGITDLKVADTITISTWGYAITNMTNKMLWSFAGGGNGPALYFTGGYVTLSEKANVQYKNGATAVANPSLNAWHHYVVTFDKANNKSDLYIDGIYRGSVPYVSPMGSKLFIGRYNTNVSYNFTGYIKNVKVYNSVLSMDEIALEYNNAMRSPHPNLIAYYPLNEGSGSVIYDNSGAYSLTNIANFLNTSVYNNLTTDPQARVYLDEIDWYRGLYTANNAFNVASSMTETNPSKSRVGLLRVGEILTGYSPSMNAKNPYWLLTPHATANNNYYVTNTATGGVVKNIATNNTTTYVRPVVSLRDKTFIASGSGTFADPYIIGTNNIYAIPIFNLDPTIIDEYEYSKTEMVSLLDGLSVTDLNDGDLTSGTIIIGCTTIYGEVCPLINGTDLLLNKAGEFDITYQSAKNSYGEVSTYTRRIKINDTTSPVITKVKDLEQKEKDEFDLLTAISISDNSTENFKLVKTPTKGGITIEVDGTYIADIQRLKPGEYTLKYQALDLYGNASNIVYIELIISPLNTIKDTTMLGAGCINVSGCNYANTAANNFVWYSGQLWRIIGTNNDGSVKMVTNTPVATLPYNNSATNADYGTSYIRKWLNEIPENDLYNGIFYKSLYNPEEFLADVNEDNKFCLTASATNTCITSYYDKIGILTAYQATGKTYLNFAQGTWLMSQSTTTNSYIINSSNAIATVTDLTVAQSIRPVINMKGDITILNNGGNGTSTLPYVISEERFADEEIYLSDKVIGEYVTLAGKNFRIEGYGENGTVLLIAETAHPSTAFGPTNKYNLSSGIGLSLNTTYINGLRTAQADIDNYLVDTNWYLGGWKNPLNYRDVYNFSYDGLCTGCYNKISSKVGLAKIGDMFSSNETKPGNILLLTPNRDNTTQNYIISNVGALTLQASSTASFTRPIISIRNDAIVSSGKGTSTNPYKLSIDTTNKDIVFKLSDGKNVVSIEADHYIKYNLLNNVVAYDPNTNKNLDIAVSSSPAFDLTKLGSYLITYSINVDGEIRTLTRTINVVDHTSPIASNVVDTIYVLNDGKDFDRITDEYLKSLISVEENSDTYFIEYKIYDSNGNEISLDEIDPLKQENYTIKYIVRDKENLTGTTEISMNIALKHDLASFAATGNYQTFIAPNDGYYRIELWGAQGGRGLSNGTLSGTSGKGAYTSGDIYLDKDEIVYFYIGGAGANATVSAGGAGGYNGGGKGGNDSDDEDSGGGGGASDVRLNSGVYNDETSLRSRIMVAAGGAGSYSGSISGGGGTLTSYASSSNRALTTQTSGNAFGVGGVGANCGSTGYVAGSAGGGGYWGGLGGPCSNSSTPGGMGGSSFISGYIGAIALAGPNANTPKTVGTVEEIATHYSGKKFTNAVMFDGKSNMPSTSGVGNMVGNAAAGYGKVTFIDPNKASIDINLIGGDEITIDVTTPFTDPGFTAIDLIHGLDLTPYTLITSDVNVDVVGKYHIIYDVYNTRKIRTINVIDTESPVINLPIGQNAFVPLGTTYNHYDVVITDNSKETIDLNVSGTLDFNTRGVYTVTYNAKDSSGNAAAPVTRNIYVGDLAHVSTDYDYNPLQTNYTFKAPKSGFYLLEAWGAQGGNQTAVSNVKGGTGAYTSGYIYLNKDEEIYIYVGGAGSNTNEVGGYNGGGTGGITTSNGRGGGGASDIRLKNGNWFDSVSLSSRIMVAGGGGGAVNFSPHARGGHAGALTGENGLFARSSGSNVYNVAYGGSQIEGGRAGYSTATYYGTAGTFGIGGNANASYGSGGGSGYYGGGGAGYNSSVVGTGAGGSSYISGYLGAIAINAEDDQTPKVTINPTYTDSIHYSTKGFFDSNIIAGNISMPNPRGENNINGNTGDGYVRITEVYIEYTDVDFTLIDSNELYHEVLTPFTDPGVIAIDSIDGDVSNKVVAATDLDINTVGTYIITYTVNHRSIQRTVHVIDTKKPDINFNPEVLLIGKGNTYDLTFGLVLTDNYNNSDYLLSTLVTTGTIDVNNIGEYIINYKIHDSSNNEISKDRIIKVTENTLSTVSSQITYWNGSTKAFSPYNASNNYVWYSGMLWRVIAINPDGTVKLITDDVITTIPFGPNSTYSSSFVKNWLETKFYPKLYKADEYIVEDSTWCIDTTATLTSVRTTCTNSITGKIGLITLDEYNLIRTYNSILQATNFINNGLYFDTLTPNTAANKNSINNAGTPVAAASTTTAYGLRPVINIKADVLITGGNGSLPETWSKDVSPYIIKDDTEVIKNNTLLNKRHIGEYVLINGYKYRIVDINPDDTIKVILDSFYQETTVNKTIAFDTVASNVKYDKDRIQNIAYYLNKFDTIQKLLGDDAEKVISNSLWYQGDLQTLTTNPLITSLVNTNPTIATIALPKVGEMFSSQTNVTKNLVGTANSWMLNRATTANINIIGPTNSLTNIATTTATNIIRPTINLKKTNIIENGTGTINDPFIITNSIDTIKPIINLIGPTDVNLEVFDTFVETNYTALDNADGDITHNVIVTTDLDTTTLGTYTINYSITDSSGNTTIVTRKVNVVDTTKPNIIIPSDPLYVNLGTTQSFKDDITVTDNYDPNIQSKLTVNLSSLNVNSKGTYTINYNVTDQSGNTDTKTRTVIIGDNNLSEAINLVNNCSTGECLYPYNATNNYVWYSGLLWRIIGINNDGTVKLITEDNLANITSPATVTYSTNTFIRNWLNNYFYPKLYNSDAIVADSKFCTYTTTNVAIETVTCTDILDKVGLLALHEYNKTRKYEGVLQNSNYLVNDSHFTLMSINSATTIHYVTNTGTVTNGTNVARVPSIRPVINIKADLIIRNGDGTKPTSYKANSNSGPYVLALDKSNSSSGALNNRSIGEYVSINNNLWRIQDINPDGSIKIILNSLYQEVSGTNRIIAFDTVANNSVYNPARTQNIAYYLNNTGYNILFPTQDDKDKVLQNASWYQGNLQTNAADVMLNSLAETTAFTSTFSLPRYGEILSSNAKPFIGIGNVHTLTRNTAANVIFQTNVNAFSSVANATTAYIRPVVMLKDTNTIASGSGTESDPYVLD